jgi:hypothetical protein
MELERRWHCRWCSTIYSLVYCQSRNSLINSRAFSSAHCENAAAPKLLGELRLTFVLVLRHESEDRI